MSNDITYDFVLDEWTPERIPMARLCQYLERLSALFGSKEYVHFEKIRSGSAIPEIRVDEAALETVQARVSLLTEKIPPKDIRVIQYDINRMLQTDGCTGVLRVKNGATIYQFPGRKLQDDDGFAVSEFGEIDGELIRIGGKDDSVPVWLKARDGTMRKCFTSKTVARELAPLLFGDAIRAYGFGKWRRTAEKLWIFDEFEIKTWERLPNTELLETIDILRAIEGSKWSEMENPQEELRKLRSDE